jgi:hypothetical protein
MSPPDSLPPDTRRYLRRVADAIIKTSKVPITNSPKHQILWAVIDSVETGPPQTVTIYLSGSPSPQAGIRFWGAYTPTEGDYVMCERYDKDLVVLGKLA